MSKSQVSQNNDAYAVWCLFIGRHSQVFLSKAYKKAFNVTDYLKAERLVWWIRCSPFTQEVEGSTPTGGTYPNDFSDPIDQDIRTQCALSWKIVVSEWRSVIAVSLNVGGGVRLINKFYERVILWKQGLHQRTENCRVYKPAKLYMCTKTHYKHNEDGCTAPGMRGHVSVPLNHSGNVVTRTGIHTHTHTHTHTIIF